MLCFIVSAPLHRQQPVTSVWNPMSEGGCSQHVSVAKSAAGNLQLRRLVGNTSMAFPSCTGLHLGRAPVEACIAVASRGNRSSSGGCGAGATRNAVSHVARPSSSRFSACQWAYMICQLLAPFLEMS